MLAEHENAGRVIEDAALAIDPQELGQSGGRGSFHPMVGWRRKSILSGICQSVSFEQHITQDTA